MEENQDPKVYTAPILENLPDCTISAHSNVGSVRTENQDFMGFVAFDDYRLLVVCDGMGGHSGGYEASRMAVEAIINFVPALIDSLGIEDALTGAIESANTKLQEFAKENPTFKGMGTTAVLCLMKGGQVWLAHVGDSRAYLIRNGEVRLLTYDHTCINRLVLMGKVSYEESIDHPIGHILERSVGVEPTVISELNDEELWLQKGDQLLLCSDGFSGLVVDDDISTLCQAEGSLDERVAKMITFSLGRHADDNVTIGILEYIEDGFPEKGAPIDKREQLKNVQLDYDAISDLETADPPELLPPPPLENAPYTQGPPPEQEEGNSNILFVIVAVLIVLVLGYSLLSQDAAENTSAPLQKKEEGLSPVDATKLKKERTAPTPTPVPQEAPKNQVDDADTPEKNAEPKTADAEDGDTETVNSEKVNAENADVTGTESDALEVAGAEGTATDTEEATSPEAATGTEDSEPTAEEAPPTENNPEPTEE